MSFMNLFGTTSNFNEKDSNSTSSNAIPAVEHSQDDASIQTSQLQQPNSPKRTRQDSNVFSNFTPKETPLIDYSTSDIDKSTAENNILHSESPRMSLRSVSSKSNQTSSARYEQSDIVDQQVQQWVVSNWSSYYDEATAMLTSSDCEEIQVDNSKVYGPEFEAGGAIWRVLLFPRGNEKHDYISIFLQFCKFAKDSFSSNRYSICADFNITLTNQVSSNSSFQSELDENEQNQFSSQAYFRFNEDSNDWGFSCFAKISDVERLVSPQDELVVNTQITVLADPSGKRWYEQFNWNSKKETGFVGIRNQGATCYMNSMLQSLYFTNILRKAIYGLPTQKDKQGESLLLALQTFFYNLQTSDSFTDTNELIKIFGWGFDESTEHRDVQEFLKILQDAIERKIKNLKVDNPFDLIFGGKACYIIKCINIDYTSKKEDPFYELILPIFPGSLRKAIEKYTEFEKIEGENAYEVEGHGKQDIWRGMLFEKLPPVLHIQLSRFIFDYSREMTVKLNDRFEFPSSIDMRDFMDPDLLANEGINPLDYTYELHAVMVHGGDSNVGHYYAFIKPSPTSGWFKFDDDRVTPATEQEAIDDNFGQSDNSSNSRDLSIISRSERLRLALKMTNAYMLVYIRRSEYGKVLEPLGMEHLPKHVVALAENQKRIELEKKERKLEELKYVTIKTTDCLQFTKHSGIGFCSFDKNASNQFTSIKLARDSATPKMIVSYLSDMNGIPSDQIRLWEISSMSTSKYSLSTCPLSSIKLDQPIIATSSYQSERKYFAEYLFEETSPEDLSELIVFVKGFWSDSKSAGKEDESHLEGLGVIKVNPSLPLSSFVNQIQSLERTREILKHTSSSAWEMYLEVFPKVIPILDKSKSLSFYCNKLIHGTILIVKEPCPVIPSCFYSLGSVEDYVSYLVSKKTYFFKRRNSSEADDSELNDVFKLDISCFAKPSELLQCAANYLDVNPEFIRLFKEDESGDVVPISSNSFKHLAEVSFLTENDVNLPLFFYDILPPSLTPLQASELIYVGVVVFITQKGTPIKQNVNSYFKSSELLSSLTKKILETKQPNILLHSERSTTQFVYFESSQDGIIVNAYWEDTNVIANIANVSVLYCQELLGNIFLPCFHYFKLIGNIHSLPFFTSISISSNDSLHKSLDTSVDCISSCQELRSSFSKRFELNAKDAKLAKLQLFFEDGNSIIVDEDATDLPDLKAIAGKIEQIGFEHPAPRESYRTQKTMTIK